MSKHMEFYIKNDAASEQIDADVYRRVSIPIDDFNAACDYYGFVKERTCRIEHMPKNENLRCRSWLQCSECGEEMTNYPHDWNYCPNCGAKVVDE